jgi:hypothetical protein
MKRLMDNYAMANMYQIITLKRWHQELLSIQSKRRRLRRVRDPVSHAMLIFSPRRSQRSVHHGEPQKACHPPTVLF